MVTGDRTQVKQKETIWLTKWGDTGSASCVAGSRHTHGGLGVQSCGKGTASPLEPHGRGGEEACSPRHTQVTVARNTEGRWAGTGRTPQGDHRQGWPRAGDGAEREDPSPEPWGTSPQAGRGVRACRSRVRSVLHACLAWPWAVLKITGVHSDTCASVGNLREASLPRPHGHGTWQGWGHEQATAAPVVVPAPASRALTRPLEACGGCGWERARSQHGWRDEDAANHREGPAQGYGVLRDPRKQARSGASGRQGRPLPGLQRPSLGPRRGPRPEEPPGPAARKASRPPRPAPSAHTGAPGSRGALTWLRCLGDFEGN